VRPHFPLTAPPAFFDLYRPQDMPWPQQHGPEARPLHPAVKALRDCMNYDDYFDEAAVRLAIASYYALVSFLDDNIGKVIAALHDAGLGADTRIIYTSDHGDNLGSRGLWGKSTMYEEAAKVPMILSGPDIPAGRVCDTEVTHLDCFPSFLEWTGVGPSSADMAERQGVSLTEIANGRVPDRTILSEYHGMGSTTGAFMIRHGRYKYVYYARYAPQLFDLESDPEELVDIAGDPDNRGILADCEALLREVCDPDDADRRAKARQAEQLAKWGRDYVVERGDLVFSPPPGVSVDWQ
jgi:choline-sulfatase